MFRHDTLDVKAIKSGVACFSKGYNIKEKLQSTEGYFYGCRFHACNGIRKAPPDRLVLRVGDLTDTAVQMVKQGLRCQVGRDQSSLRTE